MKILGIDTCMAACSVAVLTDAAGAPIQRFERMAQGHAETLFPMIETVMAEARCSFSDLSRIAVTRGPGSFTGVRAGLAAARGLAITAGLPIIGLTSLEVMARACLRLLPPEVRADGFAVMHDARRGDLYVQLFAADASPAGEAELIRAEHVHIWLPLGIRTIVGSGAELAANILQHQGQMVSPLLPGLLPEAGDLVRLAAGKSLDAKPPSPLYLRAPDAKPQTDRILARAGA
ncbi:MAG: tRNA (adenosine(37)-N6)-threonylcarbamoyltransferase complex dimerization subunit type 1 TsaB [Rhodomicrobium sp.]|nr:tRNA (adenosine(37)-N6)-threonylcarbamoyltransferase complex dimerization subunit type 1 TsaB [Rhodomicrobium sp.]